MDETMRGNLLFLLAIAGLIVFFYVLGIREKKRRRAALRRKLKEAFGKPGSKSIKPDRYALIPRYYEKHRLPGQIDDITWNDLEMDALYARIDRTCSAAGEEVLYFLLRTPDLSDGAGRISEEALSCFAGGEREEERLRICEMLSHLGHTGKYSIYDFLDALDDLEGGNALRHLAYPALIAVALCVMLFVPQGILLLMAACSLSILTYFRYKRRIEPYIVSFRYILRLMSCAELLKRVLPDAFAAEKDLIGESLRQTASFRRGAFLLGNETGADGSLPDLILDYIRILFHLDLYQFDRMLFHVRKNRTQIDDLITAVGKTDAAISIASFRESLPHWCRPEFADQEAFLAKNLYHPLLEKPVPNSITAAGPVLLTGSNASGKSTFLKAAAICALFAQTMRTVPASSYRAPHYRIYSSMALRDSLQSGESYFIVEIRSLGRILTAARDAQEPPVLCAIDEVLRGTNTTERIAASTEILSALAQERVMCFAATHDLELTELLRGKYENYHFTEELLNGDVQFSYLLKEGPATSRNAILLLKKLGYDEDIVERAGARALRFEETGKWQVS